MKKRYIHAPEKMNLKEQKEVGVMIGEDYPAPIVNHSEARRRTLSIFEESKDISR